jgi:hypothetical protein
MPPDSDPIADPKSTSMVRELNSYTTKKFFLFDSAENLTAPKSRTVKKLSRIMYFSFSKISDSVLYEFFSKKKALKS